MAFNTNNNTTSKDTPSTNVFSSVSFSNPDSKIQPSRLAISYFNRMMKLSIAAKSAVTSPAGYATYDTNSNKYVVLSFSKAYILYNMLKKMRASNGEIKNICMELKNGLLKISNGSDYGVSNYCISILQTNTTQSEITEYVYECKGDYYYGTYNYKSPSDYQKQLFNDVEIDTFMMCLYEYYRASSYAFAASVMEAGMYKREYQSNVIKAIAEKVGAQMPRFGDTSTGVRLQNISPQAANTYSSMDAKYAAETPKEYEISTFESMTFDLE